MYTYSGEKTKENSWPLYKVRGFHMYANNLRTRKYLLHDSTKIVFLVVVFETFKIRVQYIGGKSFKAPFYKKPANQNLPKNLPMTLLSCHILWKPKQNRKYNSKFYRMWHWPKIFHISIWIHSWEIKHKSAITLIRVIVMEWNHKIGACDSLKYCECVCILRNEIRVATNSCDCR